LKLPKKPDHKFVRKTDYYRDVVYEWNLPAGWSCPFAQDCLIKVDRKTGKFDNQSNPDYGFRCYAASAERFPGVREHRWKNFEYVMNGGIPVLPKKAKAVRIHSSGDFFKQAYFDMWLEICRNHPDVEFWAFTKSVLYWVNRMDVIPDNLVLTASFGGKTDRDISKYSLKWCKVIKKKYLYMHQPEQFDTNDDLAREKFVNFYLLNNYER